MKLIPRFKPHYNWRDVVASFTPSRNKIAQFEEEFSKKFGCAHGVMFSYGRSGLYALFKIWGLENAEIICPAYTCVVVSHAIVLSGNLPVFVDCAENSFNMDLDDIRAAITTRTRAIIVTHLFGYPMNVFRMAEIVAEAEKKYGHKIYVIQDCAHSFGAKWKGELVTKIGDAAIFGLNISKIINSIYGGMVITSNRETYKKLTQFRESHCVKNNFTKTIRRLFYFLATTVCFYPYIYGFVNWMERKGLLDRFVKYYDESKIDFPKDWNVWPTEIEARVGLVQLRKYDDIVRRRTEKAKQYIQEFSERNDIRILSFAEGSTYSHFVGLVDDRKKWVSDNFKKGTQLGIIVEYVVPLMSAYRVFSHGQKFPLAEEYAQRTINFPTA